MTSVIDGKAPFVLLDDARAQGAVAARLLTRPVETVVAMTAADVPALLERLAQWQAAGQHAAGFLSYEAGHALEARLAPGTPALPDGWPLGWFARFERCERIAPEAVPAILPDPAGAALGGPVPRIGWADYRTAIETVLEHIRAGDIYQANLTFAADVAVHGSPLAAYARLRAKAKAGYGGVVFTGTHWLLSQSPELFLSIKGRKVMARPMKGTAARQADPAADAAAVAELASDAKQRAENLMIVDLLRNDLSRIAVPGSVTVPSLFRVESYPTIHQMVSDVAAELAAGVTLGEVLARTFPCGSITGAPKISAMGVIGEVEAGPRGPYTGSIGFVGPGEAGEGEAAFNVAIRTLALRDGTSCATVGLGSGIVADSQAEAEWRECLAKGEYIRVAGATFDLIETMAFDPMDGVQRIDRHMERLGSSARELGFAFDRHGIRNMLQHATFRQREPARIRLRLSRDGHVAVLVEPIPEAPDAPVSVAVMPLSVDASDIRLRHKTSDRAFYDEPRKASGAFEVLFTDAAGRLTEGSFTTIFVERNGLLLTPPLALGLLPGVLRAELIAEGRAEEAELTVDDLTGGFFIGNALRGVMRAILL